MPDHDTEQRLFTVEEANACIGATKRKMRKRTSELPQHASPRIAQQSGRGSGGSASTSAHVPPAMPCSTSEPSPAPISRACSGDLPLRSRHALQADRVAIPRATLPF